MAFEWQNLPLMNVDYQSFFWMNREEKVGVTMEIHKKIAGDLLSVSNGIPMLLIEMDLSPIKRRKKQQNQNNETTVYFTQRKNWL